MRQNKAVANEAHGSSTQQYNQAQEAHLICHVRTEEELEEAAPCQHSLTRIFHSKNQLQKKKKKKGLQSAQLVLSSTAKVSRDACHMPKGRPMPTRGEVSGSSQWQRAALTPPRSGPGPGTAARHPATAGSAAPPA